jgi:ribosomal peptide maturation radical SAM protein 1
MMVSPGPGVTKDLSSPEEVSSRAGNPNIVLVSMPWESAARPSLALGTLSALAERAGFRCNVLQLNLDCAVRLGVRVYGAFAENIDLFPLAEHLFAVDAFGAERLDSDAYLSRFGGTAPANGAEPDPLYALRDGDLPSFLDEATRSVLGLAPDVVGFTCTFNQVLPSLALARRLKAERPGLTVLLGGACVHGQMGEAYAAALGKFVDYVFTGEADDSFPAWLRAFAAGNPDQPIAGVAGARSVRPAVLTRNLDQLPVPDYRAFFRRREQLIGQGGSLASVRHLPYESSRGCWWGEKHHCTFCGLNNEGLLYRRKSPGRIVAELEELAATYGITSFMAADNILDFQGYRDLLSRLEASAVEWDLFYEIKANVRRGDVAALRRAGVWRVQPGVESFSDHVLKLMRKGVSALANIQMLKWMQEYGIKVDYNVLIGFPGETLEDYRQQIRLMRLITHLPPPNGSAIVVRVDRFSPFFDEPGSLGIRGLRAAAYYPHLIPRDLLAPEKYAYFFDRDESDLDAFAQPIAEMNEIMAGWKTAGTHRRARLGRGFVEVQTWVDAVMQRRTLRDVEAAAFLLSDSSVRYDTLVRQLGRVTDRESAQAALNALIRDGILVTDGPRILAVVPFAVPHSEADLQGWLRTNLPAYAGDWRDDDAPILVGK